MLRTVILICVAAVVLQHVARIIYTMDFHKTVYNHVPGICKIIPDIEHGSEDMETLPNGLTFITSGWTVPSLLTDATRKYRLDNGVKGKMYLFDFNAPGDGVTQLDILGDFNQSDFFPHGIGLWQNKQTGIITIYVVNHGHIADSVEKFQYSEDKRKLQHIKSYKSSTMTICNDVIAVSEDIFYFTNSMYYRSQMGMMVEFLLMLSYGQVGYYDGRDYRIVLDGLMSPNGITVSRDQKLLHLLTAKGMSIYRILSSGDLHLVNEVPLGTYPDNPTVTMDTGNILIGAHPIGYKVMAHIEDPLAPTPSQVLMLNMQDGSNVESITELFVDNGETLSGSSVASLYGKRMLIGTVQHKLMLCDVTTL